MTLTPALGALAQASDTLARAIADPQSGAEAAVTTTIDITLLILGPLVGAFVGVVVSVLLSALLRKAFSKAATASSILARVRRPGHFTFAAWGAWAGLGIALVNPHLSDWNGASITTFLMHVLLIVALACLTWVAYAAAWVFEDAAKARQSSDQGRSRRFETQAQVLRRLTQSIAVVVGVVAVISTFEVARHAMTTVLASAGVISVIVGLAAQQTLGNVFAGLQLAFTDAIRVGDVVVAGDKNETGSVEEITLSYVVIRIWDERRLIIPCRSFTQAPFENWTRRAAAQLGTVELKLDWSAPMALIRAKVEQLLRSTDLWDGRTWGVQVTDSDENTLTVRILVSAKNSGTLSDLRAFMREQLISWIVTEEPWARPAQRIEPRHTVTVEQDMSRERVARLAAELAGISGANEAGATPASPSSEDNEDCVAGLPATGGAASAMSGSGVSGTHSQDPVHAARMVAARRKAKRARRRAMAERQRELAEGGAGAQDETQVISKSALRKIIEAAGNANSQRNQKQAANSVGPGERFFSGSAEADERAAAFEGPGDDVYAEREAEARRARERRNSHKRREGEALDPETTLALAAVGVEPVACEDSPEAAEAADESIESAAGVESGDSAAASAAGDERAEEGPVRDTGIVEAAPADPAPDKPGESAPALVHSNEADSAAAGSETAGDLAEGAQTEACAQSAGVSAEAQSADDEAAPADDEAELADDAQNGSAPTQGAEREGTPAPDAPEATDGEEEAQASSDAAISPDEQETTPIPARETSVKHPVQVPPPVRTGRPVMTDTVQAIAPALVPPPVPTPAEMAASRSPEETPDEPTVHPGWYAVAEEARLDAETRPTPTVVPARVSIMHFFPAVAPTGAEADMLRTVTGQIPVVEPREAKPEDAESAVTDEAATDEAAAPEAATAKGKSADKQAPADEPTTQVEIATTEEDATPEVEAARKDATADSDEANEAPSDADSEADAEGGVDVEATALMDPVEAGEDRALDSDATQVLPAVDEPVDETLVMPAAADAHAEEVVPGEEVAAAEEETPAKKETAKKEASTKAGVKKAPAKKAANKKASTAKKGTKKSAAAKKGTAKKTAPKKAAAKKASNAGPATTE
ncbi:mechanosensitive ion channel domain-containing protein [Schaalia odontolytica]|uniref:mechanosensitive ion channel domain-containing protein n=1 Tax=Schaalia odontolytica TaxID=1660 RepID=UPI0028D083A2|nr:mechanosensitive ion channel domain-containing protein [Schaalia odontolytica]